MSSPNEPHSHTEQWNADEGASSQVPPASEQPTQVWAGPAQQAQPNGQQAYSEQAPGAQPYGYSAGQQQAYQYGQQPYAPQPYSPQPNAWQAYGGQPQQAYGHPQTPPQYGQPVAPGNPYQPAPGPNPYQYAQSDAPQGPPYGAAPDASPYGQQPGQYPGQPQQWGYQQGAPATTPATAKTGSGRMLLAIVGGLVALAVVVVMVLGFAWPGFFKTTTLDRTAAQNGVKQVLTNSYGATGISGVSCPSDITVSKGSTFTCTATINGQQQKVTSTFTDDNGTYEVGRPDGS